MTDTLERAFPVWTVNSFGGWVLDLGNGVAVYAAPITPGPARSWYVRVVVGDHLVTEVDEIFSNHEAAKKRGEGLLLEWCFDTICRLHHSVTPVSRTMTASSGDLGTAVTHSTPQMSPNHIAEAYKEMEETGV